MIYITGDTHGDMNRIVRFCERMETSQEDIMIILGDVGLNYYGDSRDRRVRDKVQIMFEDIEEFLHRKLDYQ